MTKTRNIADLLDANGDVVSGALDNVPASNDASALTTGTLPSARLGTVTSFTSTGIDDNASGTSLTIASDGRTTLDATNEKPLVVHHSDGNNVKLGFGSNTSNALEIGFNSSDFVVNANGSELIRMNTGGIGIGETSLTTLTGSSSPGLTIKSDAPFIALKDNNNSNKTAYITNQGGILRFGRVDDDLSSNKVQAMQVDNEGNVSIGTTASDHNLNVQANGETTDSWFRNGHTISCSGSWQGSKDVQVQWDIVHSQSYILEFITASYGARQHFVVGSYYAGSSHQTVMTNNGNSSSSMTQGGYSITGGGERWTSSAGTHGVYCIRITTANGHHNALVTLI